jgi:hypothetical protein
VRIDVFFVIFDDYVFDSLMCHKFTTRNSAVSLAAVSHGSMLFFYSAVSLISCKTTEAVDMNGRFQMQGGKNWILPKYINANRFFWDSHWLEIWSNHFCPSKGLNGGSVATTQ